MTSFVAFVCAQPAPHGVSDLLDIADEFFVLHVLHAAAVDRQDHVTYNTVRWFKNFTAILLCLRLDAGDQC